VAAYSIFVMEAIVCASFMRLSAGTLGFTEKAYRDTRAPLDSSNAKGAMGYSDQSESSQWLQVGDVLTENEIMVPARLDFHGSLVKSLAHNEYVPTFRQLHNVLQFLGRETRGLDRNRPLQNY
jgi:hypothetical protein